LQYREFRLYWIGLVSQVTGQQMMMVTMGWLAFDLTGSPLTLGFISLLTALPRLTISVIGGVLADKWDQRKLITAAQLLSASALVTIAYLTVRGDIEVWHLAVSALFIGFVQAFDEPSRAALFPRLLPDRSMIPAAVPLVSIAWSSTRIVAPSIAGFVIAASGAGLSFFISAAGAGVMVMTLAMLRMGPVPSARSGSVWSNLQEGARFAWGQLVFRSVIGLAFLYSFFGLSFMMMLPVFASEDVLNVDSRGLGFMFSAHGVGAIAATITFHRISKVLPPGRLVPIGLAVFSAVLIAFALSPWYLLSLALLTLVGFAGVTFQTGGQVILQTLVPDELRGRVMGLHGMHWSFMPLGGAVVNVIAHFIGAPLALAGSASVLLLAALAIGLRISQLRDLQLEQRVDTSATR
ncbi:MAG: MFS transporter, partial [Dehalococcoidia bacterium]